MGVAAQAMAWQRRMHNRPGPLGAITGPTGGSGEQPTGGPQVEIWVGGWIDISTYVRYTQGIQITRGQPDENQKTNPSTASFRLDNRDGRFSPRNPLGAYYGQIDRNTPCRISVQSGNVKSYRFWGEISSWPQDWDGTGNDAWVDIQAAGILRRLGAGTPPVRSAMYMYWVYGLGANPYTNVPEIPVVYWPCEDASGATSFASGLGGAPMTFTGSPSLAASTNFVISQALPQLNGAVFRGLVPAYTVNPVPPSSSESQVEFLLSVPSGGDTNNAVVCSVVTTGSIVTWEVIYTSAAGGALSIQGKDATGAIVATPVSNIPTVNGVPMCVAVVLDQFGTTAEANLRITTMANPNQTWYAGNAQSGFTVGIVRSVTINPGGGLQSSAVGHISVGNFDDQGQSAASGQAGENAAARIQRLCGYANIAFEMVGPTWRNQNGILTTSTAMGQQDPGTLLDLIQECVDADGGILYELTDQLGLGYRTRTGLANQSPVTTLDYAQAHLAVVPKPIDDDTFTRNDITVNRLNGSFTRAQQQNGPLNVQDPPASVGRYETAVTLNVQTDAQTADQAGWRLHLGTIPEPRFPAIGVQLARAQITSSPVLRPQILSVQPGDRITVVNPPGWLPPDPLSELVIGYTERIDQFTHLVQWNSRPESAYRVAVSDDAVFGRADTDGSTLAAPALATDSVLQVATTTATSPLWTTNVNDYPFDLTLGGERVTAWGCGLPLGSIDGTFESGVTGWTPTGCTLAAAPGFSHSGTQSGLMTVTGSPSQAFLRPDTSHNAPVTVGTAYQATMWVYSPVSLGNVMAAVDWLTSGEAYISTSSGVTVTLVAGLWTPLTVTANAVATAAFARGGPTIAGSPANGTQLWVDDYLFCASSTFQSSPQTLAVLRSVNGVVKPQTQGTAVSLYQPAIATM